MRSKLLLPMAFVGVLCLALAVSPWTSLGSQADGAGADRGPVALNNVYFPAIFRDNAAGQGVPTATIWAILTTTSTPTAIASDTPTPTSTSTSTMMPTSTATDVATAAPATTTTPSIAGTPTPTSTTTSTPSATATFAADQYEPNDTWDSAYPVGTIQAPNQIGIIINANLNSPEDTDDWYYFLGEGQPPAACHDQVRVSLTNIPTGRDYNLYAYELVDGLNLVLRASSTTGSNADENVQFSPPWDCDASAHRSHFYVQVTRYAGEPSAQYYTLQTSLY